MLSANTWTAADAILANNFQQFLHALSTPPRQSTDSPEDIWPSVLATIIERLINDPPRNRGEEQRENLFYAIKVRYNRLNARIPPAVESAMFLAELLDAQDSRLARLVQRTGPRGTSALEACRDMLAAAENRDIAYPQIANALLFMVVTQSGEPYDPGIFVEALRQHRAGPKIDWTEVVLGFDKEQLRVTKPQFLSLYNALLPLAKDYPAFDIQSLWSGQWQSPDTQLSFVVAFLSTTSQELDVTQIPNLRKAFTLEDFADASDNVKVFAADAVKHPLVSQDATATLFTMIFRSQETYNHAQMLGIPETVINPNMTVFVCAASAVPKPWAALQEQALKQLFYPFLAKNHDHYDFVLYSLWLHDKTWVAGRMVEFYQQDPMLLVLIFDHAQNHGWLDLLLTISSNFAVDLATYAHARGQCNLEDWAQPHLTTMSPPAFARAIQDFLRAKMDDEASVQRERHAPSTTPLAVKTAHVLLMLIGDSLPDHETESTFRTALQQYPRLFCYGEDEIRDAIVDASGEHGNALPEEAGAKMEEQYKDMYGGKTNPEQLVAELKRLKASDDPGEQDVFAAMLHGLFDEYNCFGEYPDEALATTAVLFGGLLQYNVLSGVSEHVAISMIFEAVTKCGTDDAMYRFGLQAMIHLLGRLKEWPELAERILSIPSLRGTQAITAAEAVLQDLQQETTGLNGDAINGIAHDALDDEFQADPSPPAFSCVRVDSPLRPEIFEDADEDVAEKVTFVLNNVSKRNLEEKFKDLQDAIEDKHHQWFAKYLVWELVRTQLNFQELYLQILDNFDKKMLWDEVLRATYLSSERMLNAPSTMDSAHERTYMKSLANWLGAITLARNKPILHRNVSFKDLLIEGNETQRLIVAIPFACKTLIHAAKSKVFKPPNPWLMELLGVLSELYHCFELKINLKFEIEVLCKDLDLDIKQIEPLSVIRSARPPHPENNLLQSYVPEGGQDGFGDLALMGLSKRAPNERFSPDAVIQALPDLGQMLQIPQAAGNVTQPTLRNIFVNAAQQAIYEIIAPVVERSVTIAAISTAELVQKDFATESDADKMRNAAHHVVKALSGSLALVTCKEPLRMSIMNNIRILAARSLPDQLPEGQIIMFVNDNIETVCGLVERAAEEHSMAEIDAQLVQAISERRLHASEHASEPYNNPPVNRWAQLIPEPFRQDRNGLNTQQLSIYEDFGRQMRLPVLTHTSSQSQDTNRQLPDVLTDPYLPTLSTPAEVPIPRSTPQQRMQAPQGQQQVNGYVDNIGERILNLLQDLQRAAREAPEEHINKIGEDAPTRRIYEQIVAALNNVGAVQGEMLAASAGQQCLFFIYGELQKRLEVEVFVRLVKQLCNMSASAGRYLTIQLAAMEDDRIFNANTMVPMLQEGLFDIQHIDHITAKALKARRPITLTFLKELLDEVLLDETPIAMRADFVLTYEALTHWLLEESNLDLGREILSKLQSPVEQLNGMPSPPRSEKLNQLEYIFEEWVSLQRSEVTELSFLAFLQQLHVRNVLTEPEDAMAFFRACIDMSTASFERVTNAPYATKDAAYVRIDALAKLIAVVVIYQDSIEGAARTNKAKSLDAIVRLVVLIMNDHHNRQRDRWNGRLYFRLFSTLLCELHAENVRLPPQQEVELMQVFGLALQVMQPKYFAGFSYSWLALLSHRLFVPAMLGGSGRTNGGWDGFVKLMTLLFTTLGEMLSQSDADVSAVTQDFFRGVLRFVLMLHHDFPDFLIENHLRLNSSIPMFTYQLQNIVNSAVPRGLVNDQPDPFVPGLKVNRLDQVRQAPVVYGSLHRILEEMGVNEALERACASTGTSEDDSNAIYSALSRTQTSTIQLLANTLAVYIAVRGTAAASVFSSAAPPARLLHHLLTTATPMLRYTLVNACMNQIRYVNAHTHYFSTALQHFFTVGGEDVQQAIMRTVVERLGVPRPHPWGVIVFVLELFKNPSHAEVWNSPWLKAAPQVESLLLSLAQNQERMARSPLGAT